MCAALEEKKSRAVTELVPWEDPNFGVDEQWSRLPPYGQDVKPGSEFDLSAVVFQHLSEAETFRFRPNLPAGWECVPAYAELHVDSLQEDRIRFRVQASSHASGPSVVTADVSFRDHDLRQWIEAIVDVRP